MRYFCNTSTIVGRPLVVGDRSFEFEPIALRGGCWLGLLALDDATGAGILASCGLPQIGEMTPEQYEAEKKSHNGASNSLRSSATPRATPFAPVVADHAGRVTVPTFPINGGPNSTEGITAATVLGMTRNRPPADELTNPGAKGGKAPWK